MKKSKKKCISPEFIRRGFSFRRWLCTLIAAVILPCGLPAQQQKVSVNVHDQDISVLFRQIREQTQLNFVCDADQLATLPKITLKTDQATLESVLAKVFDDTPFEYRFEMQSILIRSRAATSPRETIRQIRGIVTDLKQHPLPGVTLVFEGTTLGTSTDAKGEFALNVTDGMKNLIVTFVGMKSQRIALEKGKDFYRIVLEEDTQEIDEVVVTGYQTVSRRESASAISTVSAKDILVLGGASIDQMLQGHIPGMMVMNTSGEPSATPKIRIRGNATINGNKSPVWVVDGVILEQDVPFTASDINSEDAEYLIGNAISGLNPQDIESISVLKDASATAIYGVKAANGVIVVTTKKGETGAPRITYNGNLTINTAPSYANYHRMNSQERVAFSRQLIESNMNISRVPVGETYEAAYEQLMAKKISQQEFEQWVRRLQTRNTDWFDELFRSDMTHTHSLSVNGGSESVKYYVSAGYQNIEGAARGSASERYSALAKVDVDYNDYLNFTVKVDYASTENTGYAFHVNPFNYAYNTSRTLPVYNEDGSYYMTHRARGVGQDYIGYNILKELANTGQSSQMDDFNALLAINLKLWKKLKYEGTFSYSTGNTSTRDWATAQSYYVTNIRGYEYGEYTEYDDAFSQSELPYGGVLRQGYTRKNGYTLRNMLSYSNHFRDRHDVSVSVGSEVRRNEYKGVATTGYGWVPEFGEMFSPVQTDTYISRHAADKPTNTNAFTQTASFFGIASYCFDNRYVFNTNIRSDGSNKFGSDPKYRWLPTWSFALKWNASNEKFLRNAEWIDYLAFRGSYGVQGNIHEDATPHMILSVGQRDDITGLPVSTIERLPNPDLRWEKTCSWNAAVDFTLWGGRLKGGLDVYRKNTSDLIMEKSAPSSTGRTLLYYNAGKAVNKGFEGFLNVQLLDIRKWSWRFGFNFGRNVNEITLANQEDLSDRTVVDKMLSGNMAIKGEPIGSLYAYRFAGLNQDNGYPLFYTKDGRLAHVALREDLELVNCGSIFPKVSGGFDTQLTFMKSLSLSLNFSYSLGGVSRLPNFYDSSTFDPLTNVSDEWFDSWKQAGDETIYPAPYNATDMSNYLETETGSAYDVSEGFLGISYPYTLYNQSDIRVAKADFLKLKVVALSYQLPEKIIRHLHVSNLMLRFQMTNLFTIADKKWKGLDPETNGANIPALPTYSFGINVSF